MAKAWKIKATRKNQSVIFNARRIVSVRLEELYSWDPSIRDSANLEALHGMRISAKRLRYSMELYPFCFGAEYKSLITKVEQIQKLLGEIQDCSVLVCLLQDYLKAPATNRTHQTAVQDLMAARKTAQRNLHRVFINFWDSLREDDFKSHFLAVLSYTAEA